MANTIPANNNTSLYNATGNATPVNGNINATNINASGNVTVGGFILANGSITTESNFVGNLIGNVTGNLTGNVTGNIILGGGNTEIIYNNSGVTGSSPAFTFNQSSNLVSATGNVAANYLFGNGSQLTGINANYGNANVEALLPVYTGNIAGNNLSLSGSASAVGNITGNYILGNGSQLTGITADYSNANVQAFLPTYSGNLNPNFVSATGNVTAAFLKTSGAQGNIVGVNYVSANFYVGDGGLLSNISSSYGNAQVATFLNAFGSNAVSTTGNVTAGYFVGNGSLLTNLTGANVTGTVANATFATSAGSATTAADAAQAIYANIANSVSGSNVSGQVANALVAGTVYTNAQPNITSLGTLSSLSVSGNVASGNLLVNNNANITNDLTVGGTIFGTFSGNISGNLVVPGGNTQVIYNASGNAGASANFAFDYGNNIMSVNGNIATGNISATGNIAGNYILGNGSQLTGLPAGYSNADVNAHLAAFGSNTVSTTGNITAGYFIGDGSALTNLPIQPGTYSNANVANYLPTFSGNLSAGNIAVTGVVSATGNITGSFFLGNGSQLTGLPATYSNANVTSLLTSFGSNTISTTGNITAGYFVGNGSLLTNLTGANVTGTVANATYAATAGTADSATTAGTVTNNAQANITSVGTLSSLSVSGNITTGGNVNTTTVQATGSGGLALKNASGTTQASLGAGGGDNFAINVSTNLNGANAQIDISPTGSGHVHIKPTGTGAVEIAPTNTGSINNMVIGNVTPAAANVTTLNATGNITGNYFIGNGSQLTGLPAGYSNADVATFLASFGSNTISTTGTVTAGNVTGGNILTAGLISATGNITGNYFVGNGSQLTGVVTAAGGSNTQIQFNDGTAFAGNTNMTFDKTTGTITLGNVAYNGLRVLPGTASIGNLSDTSVSANANPFQLIIGNSFNGNSNWAYNIFTPGSATGSGAGSRMVVTDVYNLSNGGVRGGGFTTSTYLNVLGNVTNTSSRYQGGGFFVALGGGASGNTMLTTNFGAVQAMGSGITIGNVNANLNIGNTTANYINGYNIAVQCGAGSTTNYLTGYVVQGLYTAGTGNIGNVASFMPNFSTNASNANIVQTTNYSTFYHPSNSSSIIPAITLGSIVRSSTNYHAFRNDDDLAKVRLGSIERGHYWTSNTATTSGTVNISKNDGQFQNIYPTGNITIGTFTNFVTRTQKPDSTQVNQTDVVTLLIQQGATPYTITMPTGNSQIRYANTSATVANTANSTTKITITATYNYNASSNLYLIDISPEYILV